MLLNIKRCALETMKEFLIRIERDAILAIALLDALHTFKTYDGIHGCCGSQRLVLDFSEEIHNVEVALQLLRIDSCQAATYRADGLWF